MEKKANYKAARRALLLSLPLPQIGIVFESPSLCSSANASDKVFSPPPQSYKMTDISDSRREVFWTGW
jgi:hypothetical protein